MNVLADYNVNIHAKLLGFEKLTQIENKINSLNNKTIKIKFDDKGVKKFNVDNIGKQIQNATNNSIRSSKFDSNTFYKQYYEQAKKDLKEGKKVDKDFSKNIKELNSSTASKEAQKAVKAHNSARLKAEREYINEQKRLANIRQKESDSYSNPYKDAYQSIGKKSDIQKSMSSYYKNLEIQSAKQAEMYSKIISNTQNKILNGAFDAKASIMGNKLSNYQGQNFNLINSARKEAEAYNSTLSKLKAHFDSNKSFKLSDKEIVKSFNDMTLSAEKFDNMMTQIRNTESKSLGIGVAERSANAVKKYYEDNSKAAKKYGVELKDLENRYRQAATVADKAKLDNEFKNLKSTISSQGLNGKSFFAEMNRGFKQIGQFALTYGAIQRIPYVLKQMANATLEVDSAMTELKKVSDVNNNQLEDYFNHAADSAKEYGAKINDVISSAADWKRLGYGFEESGKLADVTTLLQRVGDNMNQESSASGLISTLKGFGKDSDEALSIVDMVNEVANTQPIDTSGLFAGLERSASSMKAANNTLEQTIGLITAANSVVQDPDSVGTAYKTISMRIRGATTDLENAGLDAEGMAESTAKLREEIMALSGVDIMIDNNNFKSTYDILDELSAKWSSLTDIQQASVTELIAGKRQGNVVSALMTNFDIARKSVETAQNSEGSAERELSNYQKSMQYSIDTFKAQFQELSNTALTSDFLKGAIDTGSEFLNVLTKIIDAGGALPTLFATIGGIKLFRNLDLFY